MNIVLLNPEIPYNTGNIGRTCVATGTSLHLIRPLGFHLNEKMIKKAGLDYWEQLDLHIYDSFNDFVRKNNNPKIFMATTKAERDYTQVSYQSEDFIMFGRESGGIDESILLDYQANCIRIPMLDQMRSLNLSNSVAIILYEALRQNQFANLAKAGQLHHHQWKK